MSDKKRIEQTKRTGFSMVCSISTLIQIKFDPDLIIDTLSNSSLHKKGFKDEVMELRDR